MDGSIPPNEHINCRGKSRIRSRLVAEGLGMMEQTLMYRMTQHSGCSLPEQCFTRKSNSFADEGNKQDEKTTEAPGCRSISKIKKQIKVIILQSRSNLEIQNLLASTNSSPQDNKNGQGSSMADLSAMPTNPFRTSHHNVFERTVDIIELGFQLSLSIFDEASVWNGTDVNEAVASPDINVFLLAVRQNNLSELNELLNTRSTMLSGYVSKLWKGFNPLLLIEICSENEEEKPLPCQLPTIYDYFSDVHRIQISEEDLRKEKDQADWIMECIARLYIHAREFHCSYSFGSGLSYLDRCPGGCGLKKYLTEPPPCHQ